MGLMKAHQRIRQRGPFQGCQEQGRNIIIMRSQSPNMPPMLAPLLTAQWKQSPALEHIFFRTRKFWTIN